MFLYICMMMVALLSVALLIISIALLAGFLASGGAGIIIAGLVLSGTTTAIIGGVSALVGVMGIIASVFYFRPEKESEKSKALKQVLPEDDQLSEFSPHDNLGVYS